MIELCGKRVRVREDPFRHRAEPGLDRMCASEYVNGIASFGNLRVG
jgi:hypothetical protein